MLPQWPAWQPVALQPNCAMHIVCCCSWTQATVREVSIYTDYWILIGYVIAIGMYWISDGYWNTMI